MVEMIFVDNDGIPVAIPPRDNDGNPITPDGEQYFSVAQAAVRFKTSAVALTKLFNRQWRGLLPIEDQVVLGSQGHVELEQQEASNRKRIRPGKDYDDILHQVCYPKFTAEEYRLFRETCRQRGLNPYAKHLIAEITYNQSRKTSELTFISTLDGLLAIAIQTGQYQGIRGPFWCGEDEQWREIWLREEMPAAAKSAVLRVGLIEPLWQVARWSSYAVYTPTTKGDILAEFWQKMPDRMIGKCATSLAVRTAFPDALHGIYSFDEMQQAKNAKPAKQTNNDFADISDAIEIEDNAPTTKQGFDLALLDRGLNTDEKRARVTALLRKELPKFSGEVFYAVALKRIDSNPAKYGIATISST